MIAFSKTDKLYLSYICLTFLFTYSQVGDLIFVYGEPPKKQQKLDLVLPPEDTVPVTIEDSSDEEFVPTTDDEADETWFIDDDSDNESEN